MPCKIRPWETALLESWLREVRAQVEKDGELTEAAIKKFWFDGKPNRICARIGETASSIVAKCQRGG